MLSPARQRVIKTDIHRPATLPEAARTARVWGLTRGSGSFFIWEGVLYQIVVGVGALCSCAGCFCKHYQSTLPTLISSTSLPKSSGTDDTDINTSSGNVYPDCVKNGFGLSWEETLSIRVHVADLFSIFLSSLSQPILHPVWTGWVRWMGGVEKWDDAVRLMSGTSVSSYGPVSLTPGEELTPEPQGHGRVKWGPWAS